MTGDSVCEMIRVTDVEIPFWILKNIDPKHLRLAPEVGFEPTTNRLTADRSTTELLWIARMKECARIFCAAILFKQLTIG
jgi:hypothetical protein